jgi:hypothetical protein
LSSGGNLEGTTDVGVRAVSRLHALTFLDISYCDKLTDEALRAVSSSCSALKSLKLSCCDKLTDEALRAMSNLRALTLLDISCCENLTDEALRAVIK